MVGIPWDAGLGLQGRADPRPRALRVLGRDRQVRPVFEIRFPAIMEDQGRDMAADDRFHLDLTVTFAAPVKLEGP